MKTRRKYDRDQRDHSHGHDSDREEIHENGHVGLPDHKYHDHEDGHHGDVTDYDDNYDEHGDDYDGEDNDDGDVDITDDDDDDDGDHVDISEDDHDDGDDDDCNDYHIGDDSSDGDSEFDGHKLDDGNSDFDDSDDDDSVDHDFPILSDVLFQVSEHPWNYEYVVVLLIAFLIPPGCSKPMTTGRCFTLTVISIFLLLTNQSN